MNNIAVVGSGSWGSAIAIYLAEKGHNVKIWSFSEEECDKINNEKKRGSEQNDYICMKYNSKKNERFFRRSYTGNQQTWTDRSHLWINVFR